MRESMKCYLADMEELFITYYHIGALVREKGILTLENVIYTVKGTPALFRIGVELICGGIDPENTKKIMETLIDCSEFEEEESRIAEAMVIGLLSIQKGEEPSITAAKMAKCFGLLSIFQLNGNESGFNPNNLILFGEVFNLEISESYLDQDSLQNHSVVFDLDQTIENYIVSFLNINELARTEGLVKVYEVITDAPDTPQILKKTLKEIIDEKDYEKISQIVDKGLKEFDKSKASFEEKVVFEGTQRLFQGIGSRYLLSFIASLFGVQGYEKVMTLQSKGGRDSYYFGKTAFQKKQDQDTSREKTDEKKADGQVPRNWGELAEGYDEFELGIAASALSEVFAQYEGIDHIMPFPIATELMASAIHILHPEYIFDIFAIHAGSEDFNNLKEAFLRDGNSKDIHSRNASYLADLMMGGDGKEYQ